MAQAKNGSTVKVHYKGRIENAEVFDISRSREPLEFTIGRRDVILGLEKGVIGMEVGDKKSITVPPEEAYGPWEKCLTADVKKSDLPENITPVIGMQLMLRQSDNTQLNIIITDMNEDSITLDANHPLAGKTLLFNVELVEIA